MDKRLARVALVQQHSPEIAVGLGHRGVEPHGFTKLRKGGGLVAFDPQSVAQVVAGDGELGGEPERLAKMADGGVDVPLGDQRRSQVTQDLGVLGLRAQRGPATGDGAVEFAERPVDLGKAGMIGRNGGIESDRPADQRAGPPWVALLESHQTQQVKRIGPLRVKARAAS